MHSAHQQAQYQAEGYLVLPGFKSAAEVAGLCTRALQIVEAFDADAHHSIFSTTGQARRSAGASFLDSAEGIQCFFEEEAFDDAGRLCQAKALSGNKIGHAMHDLDPVYGRFSRNPAMAEPATDLGRVDPQRWQAMYIFKQPGIGGEVRWHQDTRFFDTTPTPVTAFWFALEDATQAKGCHWVEPGGHRGPLRGRFVRFADGGPHGALRMASLDATRWPDASTAVPVAVTAGTLGCFHGLLPHWSAPNRSARSRQTYSLHATDGRAHYAEHNGLRRSAALPVRGFTA